MGNNPNVKKWISSIVVASVVWSGAAWTTQTASAAATPFSDVVAGHWAEKHIAKLAMQNLLVGSNGKFYPNNPVSRQEAIIIALRFMGIVSEADAYSAAVIPAALSVKADYTKYINLALQKKLILIGEETALANSDPGKSWGASPASREWMARLLVRAIGKESDAKAIDGQETNFADDASIDANLKGYVKVAVENGLVSGVTSTVKGQTVTKFNPDDQLTRAMAATLFSLAESQVSVAYNGQVEGVLLNMTSDHLTALLADGTTKDFPISDKTAYYRKDDNKPITLAALRLYGKAILITGADGTVGYVEMIDENPQVKTVEGKLTLVTAGKYKFTLLIGDEYKEYYYDAGRLPAITDAAGQTISLAELPLNVDVKLTIRPDDKVLAVAVKQAIINKTGTGTVSGWNPQTLTLSVSNAAGQAETFPVSSNAPIKLNGTTNLAFDQLLVGDSISYEVKNGSVSSIVVTRVEKPVTSVTGALESIDKTGKTIVYKVDGKLEVKYLADAPAVRITGFNDATVDDLIKGDTVTLTLDNNGKVTVITVTNRSVESVLGAAVVKYDPAIKALTFKDPSGKQITKNVTDSTRVDLNGTKWTLTAANSYISTAGTRLTIGYNGENIVYISIFSKYTGVVTENNTTSKTLRLTLEGVTTGTSVALAYQYPSVEIYGKNGETFADVKVGDRITVLMNATQDQVIAMYVHKSVQFEIVSVDSAARKLKVKLPGSTSVEEKSLSSDVTIKDENGADVNLYSLTAGSIVNATLQGDTISAVRTVSVTLGKVSAVDAAAGTVTVITRSGETITKSVGTNATVKRDNTPIGGLAAIQTGDLVEIVKDENDRGVIEVATVLNRTFWKHESSTKIYVKRQTINDKNDFTISPQVYVHQGTTTLTLSSLRDGDAITLYSLRGVVVEISK